MPTSPQVLGSTGPHFLRCIHACMPSVHRPHFIRSTDLISSGPQVLRSTGPNLLLHLHACLQSTGPQVQTSYFINMYRLSPQVLRSTSPQVHRPSVVAKKLGCRLKIKLRQLKELLKCLLCFTDSSLAKNPAGNRRFFSR